MAKPRRIFVCTDCGTEAPAWTGRCPGCSAWATMAEAERSAHRPSRLRGGSGPDGGPTLQPLHQVDPDLALPFPVGVDEVDRVLGGGLTPGSVTLLAGEPGVGKSTLTLQMATAVAGAGSSVVLVAGEEAPSQVAARAGRLGPIPAGLLVVDDVSVDTAVTAMTRQRPQLLIIDSIQTMRDDSVDTAPGSISQVKAVAGRLIDGAKATGVSLLVIGHVTKEGSIAGPRLLEHMVDTVVTFDGDGHGSLRFLRAAKHRFGPTSEVGIFEMTGSGLQAVPDPSRRYLQDRRPSLPGSVVAPALAGRRPFLAEVQALVAPVTGRSGQMAVQGLVGRRVDLVAAVLASRAGYRAGTADVFLSVAGGATVDEPAGDLAVALALASAIDGAPIAPDVVACGEVGLGGELRTVPMLELRLQEAYRMGFRTAVVPPSAGDGPTGLRLIRAGTLSEALALAPQELESAG